MGLYSKNRDQPRPKGSEKAQFDMDCLPRAQILGLSAGGSGWLPFLLYRQLKGKHRHDQNERWLTCQWSNQTIQAIGHLGVQGTELNPKTCNAVVTLAENPVMRRSPYAGMIFNGLGRPLNPNVPCATLPASMGGNKTPIIDERQFYGDGLSWVEEYHSHLSSGGRPYGMNDTPEYIRRLTLNEAQILHTFPEDYDFAGGKSAIYRQIGNAVPCGLAEAVAKTTMDVLCCNPMPIDKSDQMPLIFGKKRSTVR